MGSTRVLLQQERERTLLVSNAGQRAELIQAWIDDGQLQADPSHMAVPFVIPRPVFRLDADKSYGMRIVVMDSASLAADRESMYYINVLAIPQREDPGEQDVQLAIRSRIKLFYRPAGLSGQAAQAPASLHWRLIEQQGARRLRVDNPTPWHVNLAKALALPGNSEEIDTGDGVVAPFSSIELPVPDALKIDGVAFTWIDDYGAIREHTSRIDH
nr:molecular chaperone [Stenotrophomonas indicatrix]